MAKQNAAAATTTPKAPTASVDPTGGAPKAPSTPTPPNPESPTVATTNGESRKTKSDSGDVNKMVWTSVEEATAFAANRTKGARDVFVGKHPDGKECIVVASNSWDAMEEMIRREGREMPKKVGGKPRGTTTTVAPTDPGAFMAALNAMSPEARAAVMEQMKGLVAGVTTAPAASASK